VFSLLRFNVEDLIIWVVWSFIVLWRFWFFIEWLILIIFFGKNPWLYSISILILLPAADCYDYARVYEHPGSPGAFVRCTIAAAAHCRHRWATSFSVDGNYSSLTLSLLKAGMLIPGKFHLQVSIGFSRDSIETLFWRGGATISSFVIRRPVAEKSLSHCTKVAGTLKKLWTTTTIIGYTDLLSCRQSSTLTAELLSTGANRYLWKSRDPAY